MMVPGFGCARSASQKESSPGGQAHKKKRIMIKASELILLLAQGNPSYAALPEDWRRIPLSCTGIESG